MNSLSSAHQIGLAILTTEASVVLDSLADLSDELRWAFLLGAFEATEGVVYTKDHSLLCRIDKQLLPFVGVICPQIPYRRSGTRWLYYEHSNALDFLGNLYHNVPQIHHWPFLQCLSKDTKSAGQLQYERYRDWLGSVPPCKVRKDDPAAILPWRGKMSDAGYDLTIIKRDKVLIEGDIDLKWLGRVVLYDTGLCLDMPAGYYAEIHARSSLSKSGYMLANGVGIIDSGYRGRLLIALLKVDPRARPIELPFKCCQLIFRRQQQVELIEVEEALAPTTRQDGGFGSTNS